MKVGIEVFCRIIAGFVWEGRVVANTWFVGLGYTTILDGLSFAQDMKLCLYYHVRPHLKPNCVYNILMTFTDPTPRSLPRAMHGHANRHNRTSRHRKLGAGQHKEYLHLGRNKRIHMPFLSDEFQHEYNLGRDWTAMILLHRVRVQVSFLPTHHRRTFTCYRAYPETEVPTLVLEKC
jgi:hypothetical protein